MLDLGEKVELLRKKRLVVVIPYPSDIPIGYGVNRVGPGKKNAPHVYLSQEEYELVTEAAKFLGLSISSFSRWCCTKVAEQVLKDKEDAEEAAQPELPFD